MVPVFRKRLIRGGILRPPWGAPCLAGLRAGPGLDASRLGSPRPVAVQHLGKNSRIPASESLGSQTFGL